MAICVPSLKLHKVFMIELPSLDWTLKELIQWYRFSPYSVRENGRGSGRWCGLKSLGIVIVNGKE